MVKKEKRIIVGLLAIIMILAGFIILNYSMGWLTSQQQVAFDLGYKKAVSDLISNSLNCSVVPVMLDNQSFSFVDVSCLSATG